jgi:predicted nucleotidyltransferase
MDKRTTREFRKALKGVDCERVILFGSRARGEADANSDYDILIVQKHSILIQEKMKLSAKLRRRLAQNGIDADIILKSADEVNSHKNRVGSIVRNALAEGVAL